MEASTSKNADGRYYRGFAFQHEELHQVTDLTGLLKDRYWTDTKKLEDFGDDNVKAYCIRCEPFLTTLEEGLAIERTAGGAVNVLLVRQDRLTFDQIKELGPMPVFWLFVQSRTEQRRIARGILRGLGSKPPLFCRVNLELLKDLALSARRDSRYGQVENRAINITIENLGLRVLVDGMLNTVRFDSFASKNILDSLAFNVVDRDIVTQVKSLHLRFYRSLSGRDSNDDSAKYVSVHLDSYGNIVIQPDGIPGFTAALLEFIGFLKDLNLLGVSSRSPLEDPDYSLRVKQRSLV